MTDPIHLQTGSSTVRCGAAMAPRSGEPGWDLGTVSVDVSKVTCSACLPRPNWTPSPAQFTALTTRMDRIAEDLRSDVAGGGYEEPEEVLFALAVEAVRAYIATGADSLEGTLGAITENLVEVVS